MKRCHFKCLTIDNVSPINKKHVFVSYQKDDYKEMLVYAKKIRDLLDVAVFYLEYEKYAHPDVEEFQNMVKRMDMFVPIITKKYLDNSFELVNIYSFVKNNGIPILPLIIEDGVEADFNKICGKIQFLNTDLQAQEYTTIEDKIRGFYQRLNSPDSFENDPNLFVHRIFISYRRKDRKKARHLIDLLLNHEGIDQVAIWYDEFLTIGKRYEREIAEKLKRATTLVMFITDRVFEKRNYVKDKEYVLAKKCGIPIIPVYEEPYDHDAYKRCFPDLIEPIHVDACLEKIKEQVFINFIDPSRDVLFAKAYLYGIDVIRNIDKAERILLKNGEYYSEAARLLVAIYSGRFGCKTDFDKAIYYAKKLVDLSHRQNPEEFFTLEYQHYAAYLIQKGVQSKLKKDYRQAFRTIIKDIDNHQEEFLQIKENTYYVLLNTCNLLTFYYEDTPVFDVLVRYFENILTATPAVLNDYQTYDAISRLFRLYKITNREDKIPSIFQSLDAFIHAHKVKDLYDIIVRNSADRFREFCFYLANKDGDKDNQHYLVKWKSIINYVIKHLNSNKERDTVLLFLVDQINYIDNKIKLEGEDPRKFEKDVSTIATQIDEKKTFGHSPIYLRLLTDFVFLIHEHNYGLPMNQYIPYYLDSFSILDDFEKNRAMFALDTIAYDENTPLEQKMALFHTMHQLFDEIKEIQINQVQEIKDELESEINYCLYLIREGKIIDCLTLVAEYQDSRLMPKVDELICYAFEVKNTDLIVNVYIFYEKMEELMPFMMDERSAKNLEILKDLFNKE